jgi:monoterpene epsilon-lactone hydrolase
MPVIRFKGPLKHRVLSMIALNRAVVSTSVRRLFGQRMEPSWSLSVEIGIRFWRAQFTRAMAQADMATGRAIFDSLVTETDDVYDVLTEHTGTPEGCWYRPRHVKSKATLLYLHGGGYAFDGPVSARFAAMLAHHCQAALFMPRYRLTPEHPHPAQADDAVTAWQYLCQTRAAHEIVVIGDSAGGHMALMLLQSLKARGLAQPALCVGLCPWTDIGARGDSLTAHDRFDLVQGWMAVRFGDWLDPDRAFGRSELSPIAYDFTGLAPLYLQAGGREVLHDMICEFADQQAARDVDVMLDVWPDMPHDFQAYDSMKASSVAALERIRLVVDAHMEGRAVMARSDATRVASGRFAAEAERGQTAHSNTYPAASDPKTASTR